MRTLVNEMSKDPENLAALRRSVYDLATEGAAKGGALEGFLRNNEKAETYFQKISANYKAEELSPTILAIVGDYLLNKGDTAKAEGYFTYIMEHHRSSEYAHFGFSGLADIRLRQSKAADALILCNEAIDNNITMSKEKEIRFTRARAWVETDRKSVV